MANSTPSFDDVHAALERMGRRLKQSAEWFNTNCPAHEDRNPSFGLKRADDGGAITKCQAGCKHADILDSLGFERRNGTSNRAVPTGNRQRRRKASIVEEYKYTDATGAPVYWNCRRADKSFSLRRADGKWTRPVGKLPLYGLPEIAAAPGAPVVYVEGQKDVATWRRHFGGLATTWGIGASNWKDTDHSPVFQRNVLLVSDADEPGRKAMRELAAHLHENGCTVEIALADGDDNSDVTDWVERLGADNARTAIRDATEAYRPTSGYHPRRRSPDAEVEHHLMTIQRIAKGGITFTCRGLSDLVPYGLLPGEYVILAARPGVGKTTLMVVETAGPLRAGRAVLYVNLDSHDSVHYARVCAAFRRETWASYAFRRETWASYFSTKKKRSGERSTWFRGFGRRTVRAARRAVDPERATGGSSGLARRSERDGFIDRRGYLQSAPAGRQP